MCVQVPCVYIPHTASSVTARNKYNEQKRENLIPWNIYICKFIIIMIGGWGECVEMGGQVRIKDKKNSCFHLGPIWVQIFGGHGVLRVI